MALPKNICNCGEDMDCVVVGRAITLVNMKGESMSEQIIKSAL